MKHIVLIALMVAVSGVFSASAALIINLADDGNNIVADASGSINCTDLLKSATSSYGYLAATAAVVQFGNTAGLANAQDHDLYYGGILGPATIGSGTGGAADVCSGDFVGIRGLNGWIMVPSGYVSGTALSASATWYDMTLESEGMLAGSYVWTWGSGENADSLTVNVGVIPEPSTSCLCGIFGAGAFAVRRRFKR